MSDPAFFELLKLLEESEAELELIKGDLENWKYVADLFASFYDHRTSSTQINTNLSEAYGIYIKLKELDERK
jgi:hypothetical protein